MLSPSKLEKILKLAKKYGVSEFSFDKEEISSMKFHPNQLKTEEKAVISPLSEKEERPAEMGDLKAFAKILASGMPSDEELRYQSTDYYPAPIDDKSPIERAEAS